MKKIIKLLFIFLFILFIILFLNKNNNYYENERVLTDEAIERFENDIRNGKDIVVSNYIPMKKDYSNRANIMGLKCSSMIEKIVNRCLKKFLDYLNSK